MEQKEWDNLAEALKGCLNSGGTLHYNYDARLCQLIEKHSPKNDPYPREQDYNTKDSEETCQAIDKWVKGQQDTERTLIIRNAQLHLEKDDDESTEKMIPGMIQAKKLFVHGVAQLQDIRSFPNTDSDRRLQAKALFEVAWEAVKLFQECPTALVLFPNLTIPDSRVFGGFYGSPWSVFNNGSFRLKFRETNPYFKIHVCTTWESEFNYPNPSRRRMGVVFTYDSLW